MEWLLNYSMLNIPIKSDVYIINCNNNNNI